MRIVMAGGGTGGHLYPGLAVAEALERNASGQNLEILWAATPRAVDQRLLSKFGDRFIRQTVKPLTISLGKLWSFWRGWRETCTYWDRYFNANPVDCVVALGGYAAGPAAHVAARRGTGVVLLNPDALPGRANRFLLKRANVVVTQWAFIGAGDALAKRVRILGCPIRRELVGRPRDEGAKRLGIDATQKTLVITGASLGARTINDALIALLADEQVRPDPSNRAAIGSCSTSPAWNKLPKSEPPTPDIRRCGPKSWITATTWPASGPSLIWPSPAPVQAPAPNSPPAESLPSSCLIPFIGICTSAPTPWNSPKEVQP